MPQHSTLADVVRTHVGQHPERDAFVYLHEDGLSMRPERLTYRELDRRARVVARQLREESKGDPSRPVLLLYPPTLDFVAAFLGCLYAGRTAIPAPMPDEPGERLTRVSRILRDASVGAVLTLPEQRQSIAAWLTASGELDIACLGTGEDLTDPGELPPADVRPGDAAFLQYSSGSTSEPKGVIVTHANLAANEEAIRKAVKSEPGVVIGGWLPLYHDMGLIGVVLHPLWMGGTSVLMPPISFIKRPHRWLQMIQDHQVEGTASPNFAYDLCTRRVTEQQSAGIDLSGLRFALNGAEPVRAETMRAFSKRFAANGLRPHTVVPCYGLAENTLMATCSETQEPFKELIADAESLEQNELRPQRPGSSTRTLVSSGRAQGCEVLIADPATRKALPDGSIGEIWLRGTSAAAGYWNRAHISEETFRATTAEGHGPYMRTGDLGGLLDGELFVTGRIKEMLIHRGRNLYPQDIEHTVQESSADFRPGGGAVFTVFDGEADLTRVVVLQELHPRATKGDLTKLTASVQTVLSREFQLPSASVVLVRPGVVRKTTSGKTQRTLMRQLFLEGDLPILHQRLEPQVAALVERSAANTANTADTTNTGDTPAGAARAAKADDAAGAAETAPLAAPGH